MRLERGYLSEDNPDGLIVMKIGWKPAWIHETKSTWIVKITVLDNIDNSEWKQAWGRAKAGVGSLQIRSTPSIYGREIGIVPPTKKLLTTKKSLADLVNGKSGYWYKIKYDGMTGFVWGNHIEFLKH